MLPTRPSLAEQGEGRQSTAEGIAIARHRAILKGCLASSYRFPFNIGTRPSDKAICELTAPLHSRGPPAPPCLA